MKQMLEKLAMWFLRRNGYVVRSKAEYNLVPDFILQMQQHQVKQIDPLPWDCD